MISKKGVFGIDFGTSNSAIVGAYTDENSKPFLLEVLSARQLPQMPTAVYQAIYGQNAKQWYVGQDALDQAGIDGEYPFINFKPQLLHPNIRFPVHNDDIAVKDLAQRVIEQLLKNAENAGKSLGESQIVVTHPIGGVWEKIILGLYKDMGLENVTPISEPEAALYYAHNQLRIFDEQERIILLIDFGGGTCDFLLLKVKHEGMWPFHRPTAQVIHPDYYKLGGSDLDFLIAEKLLQSVNSDESLLVKLREKYPQAYLDFIEKIKAAKEHLSRNYNVDNARNQIANITLQIPTNDVLNLSFSAIDLKKWTTEKIETAFQQIFFEGIPESPNHIPLFQRQTAQQETIVPEDVSLILLTGGSSQFPWVYQDILPSMFRHLRDSIHILDSPHLSVAYGAALYAYDRHFSNETRLARYTMGALKIVLADGTELELVPQGTKLPVNVKKRFRMKQTKQELSITLIIGDENRASNHYMSFQDRLFKFKSPIQEKTIMHFDIEISEFGEIVLSLFDKKNPNDMKVTKYFNSLELNWENRINRPNI